MAILPGTRLGPYEVLSAIGAGGMGEVYRAQDKRLNRDVALKVIPDAFAADSERMARFEREAKLLGLAQSSAHRLDLRPRGIRRDQCPGHGIRRRSDPRRSHRRRTLRDSGQADSLDEALRLPSRLPKLWNTRMTTA